jgi:hypothetical protein
LHTPVTWRHAFKRQDTFTFLQRTWNIETVKQITSSKFTYDEWNIKNKKSFKMLPRQEWARENCVTMIQHKIASFYTTKMYWIYCQKRCEWTRDSSNSKNTHNKFENIFYFLTICSWHLFVQNCSRMFHFSFFFAMIIIYWY